MSDFDFEFETKRARAPNDADNFALTHFLIGRFNEIDRKLAELAIKDSTLMDLAQTELNDLAQLRTDLGLWMASLRGNLSAMQRTLDAATASKVLNASTISDLQAQITTLTAQVGSAPAFSSPVPTSFGTTENAVDGSANLVTPSTPATDAANQNLSGTLGHGSIDSPTPVVDTSSGENVPSFA